MKPSTIPQRTKQKIELKTIMGMSDDGFQRARVFVDNDRKDFPDADLSNNVSVLVNFYKADIDIDDSLLPTLDVYEQSVYRRLYRLSWGFNKNWCQIGYNALVNSCNITKNKISEVLKKLESDGWIANVAFDRAKGTTYRVYLPSEKGMESKTKIGNTTGNGVIHDGIPSSGIPQHGGNGVIHRGIPQGITRSENPINTADSEGVIHEGIPQHGTNIDRSVLIDHSLLVTLFYSKIGQEKISKDKRERALKDIQELEADGFTKEDISYAIDWTIKNAKKKPYDFSLIKSTIGQAMADKEKDKKRESIRQELSDEQEQMELEAKAMSERKSFMPDDERKELKEKALERIRADERIKPEFITDMLVEATENEILNEMLKERL